MTLVAGVAAATAVVFWPIAANGARAVMQSGAALTTDPVHVNQTVQGCRNDISITLPNGDGDFVCPDSAYTTGNLKGWSELDLVPFRLTTSTGASSPATQTYDTGVAFDAEDGGTPGFDLIGPIVLNTTLSDASCVLVSQSDQTDITPGFGGVDRSIGRTLRITQLQDTTCVFDYYGRLALGSHLFPGSSLHGNLSDGSLSGTNQDVPLPVKNSILPQSINKTMLAQRDTDHTWDVTKSPSPASLDFGNVCDSNFSNTAGVDITVTWTKGDATPFGKTSITTHVYATNPATRTITVSVSDSIYAGTDQTTLIDTALLGSADIPPNTTAEVGTGHTVLTSDTSTHFNDVATATYTDKVTGLTVPGNTQATASEDVKTGAELNQSATITDSESITGTGLSFKVATPSVGSFTNGYTAGSYVPNNTLSEVDWSSGSQSASSTVTFNKTVMLDPAQATSGTLSDTANLAGSSGASSSYGPLDVNISSSKLVSLTINKTVTAAPTSDTTFYFDVSGPTASTGNAITVKAGKTSGSVTLDSLAPGNYTVSEETPPSPWIAPSDQSADLSSACSGSVSFANTFAPATAQATKTTVPSGHESGWSMTLHGNDNTADDVVSTTAAGLASFTKTLVDGVTYTISETVQSGWDRTGISGSSNVTVGTSSCSFTVHYPANAGALFSCAFTNTERGSLKVTKTVNWNGITPDAGQTFLICIKGPSYPLGTETGACHTYGSSGGDYTFTNLLPGNYVVSETAPGGTWTVTGNNGATIAVPAGGQGTATITNTRKLGSLKVTKTVDWIGSSPNTSKTFQICIKGPSYPLGTETGACQSIGYNGGDLTWSSLIPGSYSISETNPGSEWTVQVTGSPATVPTDGGQGTASVKNTLKPGGVKVIKTVAGVAPSGTQSFTFQLRDGASTTQLGNIDETLNATAANGGVLNFTTVLTPGKHYQLCELVMPGWTTTLNGGVGLFVPGSIIPPTLPNPNVDNSPVCVDFVAVAGQTTSYTVDNTRPGGRALTIGFWKNWSTCSGGGQKPILDQTLASFPIASGKTTHGVYVGTEYVDTCAKAVAVLNKSDYTSGKKMASDPAYNLAAQLLAYDLNIQGGAGTCGSAITAAQQAQTLLATYNFSGSGSYTSGANKMTSADQSKANTLAATLDSYNNDKLC
jgi:hypothetical protein